MCSFASCASTARVARRMNSGHGSSSSSLVSVIRFSRLVAVVVLSSLLSSLVLSWVLCGSCDRRRGVLIINRSIRRCARLSAVSIFLLSVQDAQPYITVGVTVQSKSLMRDFSG